MVGSRPPLSIKLRSTDRFCVCSGIFGYINYLVEKDRKYIIETLVNGTHKLDSRLVNAADRGQVLHDWNIEAMILRV